MREVNTADLLANPVVNERPNTTVEVDESLFIRRKIIRGVSYYSKGNLQETHECFVYTVPDSWAAILLLIIQRVSGSPMEAYKPWAIPA